MYQIILKKDEIKKFYALNNEKILFTLNHLAFEFNLIIQDLILTQNN